MSGTVLVLIFWPAVREDNRKVRLCGHVVVRNASHSGHALVRTGTFPYILASSKRG